jgi:transglutaminase-like putative cysteine protease
VGAYPVGIGSGTVGTYRTVQLMRRLVRSSLAEPLVRFTAAQIVRGLGGELEQARAIAEWLGSHVEFLRDPRGVEYLTDPAKLLRGGYARGVVQGDCDDVAMLAAALGMAVGLRARFVVLGRHPWPDGFEHVYTMLGDPSGRRWLELDPTRPFQGIDPAYLQRRAFVEV